MVKKFIAVCAVLTICSPGTFAFSLLGPYAPWMTPALSYRLPGDVGGPMLLEESYRWNIPTLTYGFDQEFVNYFGSNGVSAVESAISILNALPPASQMNLQDFELLAFRNNQSAEANNMLDMKTAALGALVEQLGLAQPTRFTWTLRDRIVGSNTTNYTVVQRNFDPTTLAKSDAVNESVYTYEIFQDSNDDADAFEFLLDPEDVADNAAADLDFGSGEFFTNLSRDDAGGLCYLLNATNQRVETLPPMILLDSNILFTASRPGVDKIQFTRMQLDSETGNFIPQTNVFVDHFFDNGNPAEQVISRVVDQPDILFRARDLGATLTSEVFGGTTFYSLEPNKIIERSDTSDWMNLAAQNNQPSGLGPGVIPPGATITFAELGRYADLPAGNPLVFSVPTWASFDESTNAPVSLEGEEKIGSITISAGLQSPTVFRWSFIGYFNAPYAIEFSTNLTTWQSLTNVTNTRGIITVTDEITSPPRFYRAVKQ